METFLIRALELICSLSLLVIIHEFGHFAFARLFGVRVEKYYVFFNPKFSLMRWKKINGKWQFKFFAKNLENAELPKLDAEGKQELDKKGKPVMRPMTDEERKTLPEDDWRHYPETTEWGIGWLPLGGYCAIAGMVDETTTADQLSDKPQVWEYRSQSTWKRMLIITGGVLFNFLAAGLIYGAVLLSYGEEYVPMENAKMGEQFSETMLKHGFRHGDKIISINGQTPETIGEAQEALLLDEDVKVVVMRDGDTLLPMLLPDNFSEQVLEAGEQQLLAYRFPFVVKQVQGGSPAAAAGMLEGDSLVAIDTVATVAFQDVQEELAKHPNDTVQLSIYRAGKPMKLTAVLDENGKLGVGVKDYREAFVTRVKEYNLLNCVPYGFKMVWDQLSSYARSFKLVFSSAGVKQMGGFGAIGSLFPAHWDWLIFWNLSAFISIILGFMNILPIPGLDGGHVMFLLYEMITGKKPSDKWMERLTTIGFIFLFALIVYANLNDIIRYLF